MLNNQKMNSRWSSVLFLGLVTGCGSSDIGQVQGTLKLDGQPLANALVEFYPSASGVASAARTNAQGEYKLRLGRDAYGAKVGDHKVQVWTSLGVDSGDNAPPRETIPAKYNVKSELKAEVNSGSNTVDFDLESKGEIVHQPGVKKK